MRRDAATTVATLTLPAEERAQRQPNATFGAFVVHLVPLARALSLPTDSLLRLSTLEAVRLPERARQVCAQVRQKLVVSDTLRTGTYV